MRYLAALLLFGITALGATTPADPLMVQTNGVLGNYTNFFTVNSNRVWSVLGLTNLAAKLNTTNGVAVSLTGSLTNVSLWTTNDARVGTAKAEAFQIRNLQTDSRFWIYLTNTDAAPRFIVTATPDTDDPTGLGASTLDDRLKAWTEGDAYQFASITRDSDGVITTATVTWPDGSAGTFTTTTKNSTWLTVDAYTITHTSSGKTVVQSAVTRNTSGAVTTKPALTITNP